MENNIPQRKGNYPIPRQDFVYAWKLTFKRLLFAQYEKHAEDCLLAGVEALSYDIFCECAFMNEPKLFEHREN